MDLYDEIYYSLIGELTADRALPWVDDAFAEGGVCHGAMLRLDAARQRLLERLGREEDRDLDELLSASEEITRLLCRQIMQLRRD